MPIYEYVCTACDHRADILLGLNDPGPLFCPACGSEGTMRKLFAVPAIHYKGSGWAKKDRSSRATTKASSSSSEDASPTPSGDASPSTTSTPAAADSKAASESSAKASTSTAGDA